MLEKEIEQKLVKHVEKLGGLCWKFTSPGTVGVPDRIIIMPENKIIFAELKTTFGRLANIQKYRIGQLLDHGCDARVIKGAESLNVLLNEVKDYAI